MKTHYTAKEIARATGLTEQGVNAKAKREDWPWQKRAGRGGGREYAIESLPRELQEHIKHQHLDTLAASIPTVAGAAPLPAVKTATELPALTTLTGRQVSVMDARMWFMRLIQQRPNGISVKKSQHYISERVAAGEQPYAQMAATANDRQGNDRGLAPRTLMRWWTASNYGQTPAALAPQDSDAKRVAREAVLVSWCRDYKSGQRLTLPADIPAWLPYLLDEYRQPQKPDLAQAHRNLRRIMPPDMLYPSYDQVKNITKKIPATILKKGRMTGAEYKTLLGYASRDASMNDPFTICQIDGHSLKAYVAHPTTGAHFHPEVCGIICLTTKVLGGWSAGWAESNQTVADAYRHCCTITESKPFGSVPAIVEPDRGPGNLAKVNSDELTGRFARLGTTFLPPEQGGNPQGHGAIERSNQSIWIRAAKSLVTYTGKDMDRCTRKRVYTRLERDLKAVQKSGNLGLLEKTSKLLMSWREFLDWLHEWAMEYNNTPHSALPKITCPQTGRRRHMTPLEALAQRISQGWQPVTYPEDMLPHLFMPHERITVRRQRFTVHGNTYHAHELYHYHDQEMIVAYDIHDANYVWVLDMDERPICRALWNGNKVRAQAESVTDQAIRNRAARQLKNLENKSQLIRKESEGTVVIEHTAELQEKRAALAAPAEEAMIVERPRVAGKLLQLHASEPEPAGFQIPEGRQERLDLWISINERVEAGDESLIADELRWHVAFRNSPVWKAWSRIHLSAVK